MPNGKQKSWGFDVETPQGKTAEAELHKIEQEFPTVQLGRAKRHDLENGGECTRQEVAKYANFQVQSKLVSAERSRIKIKVHKTAERDLLGITDILGMDKVLEILSNHDNLPKLNFV